ncbi:MAG: tetratricopeptide repeat protein [Haliscomenobacter sp.]|nr:tetratricopeptide repeat protein [Haliscomenobacter sp.]
MNMRWLLLLPVFLFFVVFSFSQDIEDPKVLLKQLQQAEEEQRPGILYKLVIAYLGNDKEKSIRYGEQALAEAESIGSDSMQIAALSILAMACQHHGEDREGLAYAQRALELAKEKGTKRQLLEAYGANTIGMITLRQTDRALETARDGLKLAEAEHDTLMMVNFMEIIAASYKELHQWEEAEPVYQKERSLVEALGRPFEKGRLYSNWGELYGAQFRFEQASPLFEQACASFRELGYKAGESIALLNLADCYYYLNQKEKAEQTYRRALELNLEVQEPELEGLATIGLGRNAFERGEMKTALDLYRKAEALGKEYRIYSVLRDVYGEMEKLFVGAKNYPEARKYYQLNAIYEDSVLTQDIRDRVTELEVKYETQKKEAEINAQKLSLSEQQRKLFRQRTLIFGLLTGLLAFGVVGLLFHNRYRLRQKARMDAAVIREQQLGLNAVIEAQEGERQRVARELHDGVAQELLAVSLGIKTVGRKLEKQALPEADMVRELDSKLEFLGTEVRQMSHVMLPPTLKQHGLAPSLELLVRSIEQHAGFKVNLDMDPLPIRLEERVELGLYRIVQELLHNIFKHAQAGQVAIQLRQIEDQVLLRVEDNGVGFDFESARQKGTMGILNVLSRVHTLGGQFVTESAVPRGTVSIIRIPLAA